MLLPVRKTCSPEPAGTIKNCSPFSRGCNFFKSSGPATLLACRGRCYGRRNRGTLGSRRRLVRAKNTLERVEHTILVRDNLLRLVLDVNIDVLHHEVEPPERQDAENDDCERPREPRNLRPLRFCHISIIPFLILRPAELFEKTPFFLLRVEGNDDLPWPSCSTTRTGAPRCSCNRFSQKRVSGLEGSGGLGAALARIARTLVFPSKIRPNARSCSPASEMERRARAWDSWMRPAESASCIAGGRFKSRMVFATPSRLFPTRAAISRWVRPNSSARRRRHGPPRGGSGRCAGRSRSRPSQASRGGRLRAARWPARARGRRASRPEAAVPRHQLVGDFRAGLGLAHHLRYNDGLEHAELPDGLRKLRERLRIKLHPRLERVRPDTVDFDLKNGFGPALDAGRILRTRHDAARAPTGTSRRKNAVPVSSATMVPPTRVASPEQRAPHRGPSSE